jgi:hypothetical protein
MSPRYEGLELHPACEWCKEQDPIIIEHKAHQVFKYVEGFLHRPCLQDMRAFNKIKRSMDEAGWTQADLVEKFDELLNALPAE